MPGSGSCGATFRCCACCALLSKSCMPPLWLPPACRMSSPAGGPSPCSRWFPRSTRQVCRGKHSGAGAGPGHRGWPGRLMGCVFCVWALTPRTREGVALPLKRGEERLIPREPPAAPSRRHPCIIPAHEAFRRMKRRFPLTPPMQAWTCCRACWSTCPAGASQRAQHCRCARSSLLGARRAAARLLQLSAFGAPPASSTA